MLLISNMFLYNQTRIRQFNPYTNLVRFLKMGMPDVLDEGTTPGLPKEADQQLEVPKNKNDNRNTTADPGSVRSVVDIKKEIINTDDETLKQRLFQNVRFRTSSKNMSSLREYVDRMVEGQFDIYYMVGRNLQQLNRSPFVRRFVEAGLEVIYMTDPTLDDQVVKKLGKRFDGFRLVSVHSELLELPQLRNQTDRKKRSREALDEFLPLCKRLKSVYPHQIERIVISNTVQSCLFLFFVHLILIDLIHFYSWSRALAPCFRAMWMSMRLSLHSR